MYVYISFPLICVFKLKLHIHTYAHPVIDKQVICLLLLLISLIQVDFDKSNNWFYYRKRKKYW